MFHVIGACKETSLKGLSDCKDARFYFISLDKGNSSDRGYNCKAKLSREHSEQFTVRECMRPSFEGLVNMDL